MNVTLYELELDSTRLSVSVVLGALKPVARILNVLRQSEVETSSDVSRVCHVC